MASSNDSTFDPISLQIRNTFYLGDYKATIETVLQNPPTPSRTLFLLRSHLALGEYPVILSKIPVKETNSELRAMRLLTEYMDGARNEEECYDTMKELCEGIEGVAVIATTMFVRMGKWEDGLRCLGPWKKNLEW